MRQRLGIARALVGEPQALILDEPANGLDPEGIAWLRVSLRSLASEVRTVLVSSHVLSEVQQTVDDVVIISRGRLVHAGPLADLGSGTAQTIVRSPEADRLAEALRAGGGTVGVRPDGALAVTGLSAQEAGHIAFTDSGDLERVFLELTGGAA
jgi:ABC-2 type transport system ATP-binding protein